MNFKEWLEKSLTPAQNTLLQAVGRKPYPNLKPPRRVKDTELQAIGYRPEPRKPRIKTTAPVPVLQPEKSPLEKDDGLWKKFLKLKGNQAFVPPPAEEKIDWDDLIDQAAMPSDMDSVNTGFGYTTGGGRRIHRLTGK